MLCQRIRLVFPGSVSDLCPLSAGDPSSESSLVFISLPKIATAPRNPRACQWARHLHQRRWHPPSPRPPSPPWPQPHCLRLSLAGSRVSICSLLYMRDDQMTTRADALPVLRLCAIRLRSASPRRRPRPGRVTGTAVAGMAPFRKGNRSCLSAVPSVAWQCQCVSASALHVPLAVHCRPAKPDSSDAPPLAP